MIKNVAVILSGCGVFDGAEIQESVFALLALDNREINYRCFAPDKNQHHVINHITGNEMPEQRNVMIEASRIVRGNISSLTECSIEEFDALLLPGGFGVAKNLSDFAFKGIEVNVDSVVLDVCRSFARANKPAGYACIAPALIPVIYGNGINLTIGNDVDTVSALTSLGAIHHARDVTGTVVDKQHKVVTTPAYMLAQSVGEAWQSMDNLVSELAKL